MVSAPKHITYTTPGIRRENETATVSGGATVSHAYALTRHYGMTKPNPQPELVVFERG